MIERLGILDRLPKDFPWLNQRQGCVQFEFVHEQTYLEETSALILQVLLANTKSGCRCIITTTDLTAIELSATDPDSLLDAAAEKLALMPIELNAPLPLEPVFIAKPWGQEIWYSGIESRGVSTTHNVPIAWILDIFGHFLGCNSAPVLLKILDPFPDENLGDLYFELHEEKTEVYIVTYVDRAAWPDGMGKIRYGFDHQLITSYGSKEAFLTAYLNAVENYEVIRREIDGLLRALKQEKGIDGDTPLKPRQLKTLLEGIPEPLSVQEQERRDDMNQFTQLVDITEGDVLTVEPFVPHSLQHGVRVIEFQTPHYERHILSFGQEVITQTHWDTRTALDRVIIEQVERRPPVARHADKDIIADFDAFQVERMTLASRESASISCKQYKLIMGVTGTCQIDGRSIAPETAWFLPASNQPIIIKNESALPATILIAAER